MIQIDTLNNNRIITIKNKNCVADIAIDIGNTLFKLNINNKNCIYFPYSLNDYKSNNALAGIPLMHPWVNRIDGYNYSWNDKLIDLNAYHSFIKKDANNLPLHGLLLKYEGWNHYPANDADDSIVTFLDWDTSLPFFEAFPFKHRIEIEYKLLENGISISKKIINLSDSKIPISSGFHPYFKYDKRNIVNIQLNLPVTNFFEADNRLIPNGKVLDCQSLIPSGVFFSINETPLDHVFETNSNISLVKLEDIQLLIETTNYPYLVVYTPKDRDYLCIEPVSSPTNVFQLYQNQLFDDIDILEKNTEKIYGIKILEHQSIL